jgi:Zn-dependent protease
VATTYISDDFSKAVSTVSGIYSIKDFKASPKGDNLEFLISDSDIKESFPRLIRALEGQGMIAKAKRSNYIGKPMPTLSSARLSVENGIVLTVYRISKQPAKKRIIPIPLLLFIATVVVVFIDGVFRSRAFAPLSASDPILMAGVYTMSLMGILGVHEMGHMIAARTHRLKASWPYFIPSVPGIFLSPTFGAMIQLRSNIINRNAMFDVGIAGPVAGLVVTIIVSIYGATTSILVNNIASVQGAATFKPSILMTATMVLAGKGANGILIMSPIMYAALIGFIITFLNLIPAWQLDGGHLARAALGKKLHKWFTYGGIAALFALYWFPMALLVLILSFRAPESSPLDDVTPLSRGRKALFVVALGLAVLCASQAPLF